MCCIVWYHKLPYCGLLISHTAPDHFPHLVNMVRWLCITRYFSSIIQHCLTGLLALCYFKVMIISEKETYKKDDPNSKPARYLVCTKKPGNTKKFCEQLIYGTDNHNSGQIENTKSFKVAVKQFKDTLVTPTELAEELNKNILQDKDKGAKNVAIRMGVDAREIMPKEKGILEVGDVRITFGPKPKKNEN